MTTHIPSITLPAFVFEQPAISTLLPVALGTAVGYSMRPDVSRRAYTELKMPPLHPPAWVFGPVWTTLYASMGYAAYRAWNIGTRSPNPTIRSLARQGATLYTIQLGLNLVWMPLYFRFKRPIIATLDIVTLTATTGYLTYIWNQVDETASALMLPYMGWLSFATYLCSSIGYLNNWDFTGKDDGAPSSSLKSGGFGLNE